MTMELWQLLGHAGITLAAVIGMALRIEHRLTKIETDVSWLKTKTNPIFKGECRDGEHCEVDSA